MRLSKVKCVNLLRDCLAVNDFGHGGRDVLVGRVLVEGYESGSVKRMNPAGGDGSPEGWVLRF